ncbi:hypothetical protein FIBSPDRAFT_866768 [Athelia psychrophila]|uniref:Uncharacterized protein n=1 Tax=Athelia psychrophila TaxID=1759441 RepID=A0A166EED9_9AGAM|nr:hypothetical protein FIBSPDRAFT_866768 [Fibularhizoctonia sp. CBS 109695]
MGSLVVDSPSEVYECNIVDKLRSRGQSPSHLISLVPKPHAPVLLKWKAARLCASTARR